MAQHHPGLPPGLTLAHNPHPRSVQKHPDKPGAGAKARKHLRGQKKVHAVMSEFKRGTLRSGSGEKVTNRKQAIAIALKSAGLSRRQKKR